VRRIIAACLLGLFLVLVVLPVVIVKGCRYPDSSQAGPDTVEGEGSCEIRVWVHTKGQVVTLKLEDYIAGVVAAEMPTSFEMEALKAQAVVARTFAVRNMRRFGGQGVPGHPEADVSTDIWSGGQAWLSEDDARRQWGVLGFYSRWQRVTEAAAATAGLIVTYNGVPIEAAYHSTCGGATENSEDVWQEALPYLRGKTDPWCADSPWTRHETDISVAAVEKAFGLGAGVLAAAAGQGRPYLQILDKSPTGRAKTIRVGEKTVTASEFRRALGLESARFTYTASGGTLHFVTSGYGHGVGMCQYGANGMAKAGKTFRDILEFYYTGVEIEPMKAGF